MSCGSRGLLEREKPLRDWLGVPSPQVKWCGERENGDLPPELAMPWDSWSMLHHTELPAGLPPPATRGKNAPG